MLFGWGDNHFFGHCLGLWASWSRLYKSLLITGLFPSFTFRLLIIETFLLLNQLKVYPNFKKSLTSESI